MKSIDFLLFKVSKTSINCNQQGNVTDRYTKTVLTIIAILLVFIAIRATPVVSSAMAYTGLVEVKVVGLEIPSYRPIPVSA